MNQKHLGYTFDGEDRMRMPRKVFMVERRRLQQEPVSEAELLDTTPADSSVSSSTATDRFMNRYRRMLGL